MAKAEPNGGDVPIMLDGKEHMMVPSLQACRAISRLGGGGGANAIVNRCRSLDFDTICEVIALGTGFISSKQREQIELAVYQQGTIAVQAACIEFVHIVNNGGTRPVDDDEEGEGDRPDPLSKDSLPRSSMTA